MSYWQKSEIKTGGVECIIPTVDTYGIDNITVMIKSIIDGNKNACNTISIPYSALENGERYRSGWWTYDGKILTGKNDTPDAGGYVLYEFSGNKFKLIEAMLNNSNVTKTTKWQVFCNILIFS